MQFVERASKRARATARTRARKKKRRGNQHGARRINPFSGETLPVWVANYVLMEYGTGAVMSSNT